MDVCVGKSIRIVKAGAHVRVCGKVDDGVDVVFAQATNDVLWRGNVPLEKGEARLVVQRLSVFQ